VEGKGQKVGLLLMPPPGGFDAAAFDHRPLRPVRGRLSIDGAELEPVDPDEVRRAAIEMVETHHVRAFAVTGYASHVNPAHELAVAAAVRQATGLMTTCGHEISTLCGYNVRASTATLNARIIPCLRDLLERFRDVLARRGVDAPVMVVRSDGALMNVEVALERPVETLLSGPAASVAGVRYLSDAPDALVFDMGGTTSDTAVLRGGEVKTDPDGASVGPWRTHVKALAVRTLGLGGDSEIVPDPASRSLRIGPRRVLPLCRLAESCGATAASLAFDALDRLDDRALKDGTGAVYFLVPGASAGDGAPPSPRQRAVLEALATGPQTVASLLEATGVLRPSFLDLEPLVDRMVVQRAGFTPTDALHVLGRMAAWDAEAARRAAARLGRPLGMDAETLARAVVRDVARAAARELLLTRIEDLSPARPGAGRDGPGAGPVGQALLARGLGEISDGLGVRFELGVPVVGIGAPAPFFVPEVARLLHTEAVIPQDGDVANAIGAITSDVQVSRSAVIQPDELGIYHVQGLPGAPWFSDLQDAESFCMRELEKNVRDLAARSGAVDTEVDLRTHDRVTVAADGTGLFLGRTVEAVASGRPC
jgi:N-methylhydantoinase A/oxoprolinase/acetone carboxylase beta subunit